MVGLTRMNPLSGLISESGREGGKSLRRPLFGVWPVARMTNCVDTSVPFVSWTLNMLPSLRNPLGGITMREPVMSLSSISLASII